MKLDIDELTRTVTENVVCGKKNKQATLNKQRSNWCKENSKKYILTYHVKSEKVEEKYTICRKGKEIEESVVRYVVSDEAIIESLKLNAPNDINEKIYWFDNGHYLFTTDNNVIYNLKKKPRPFTKEEKTKYEELKNELEEEFSELKEDIENVNVLLKGYRDNDCEILNNPQYTFLFLQYPNGDVFYNEGKEAFDELKSIMNNNDKSDILERYNNDEDFKKHLDILNEKANYYTDPLNRHNKFLQYYEKVKSIVKSYKEKKKELNDNLTELYNKCEEECIYEIHPLAITNQVKVYTYE